VLLIGGALALALFAGDLTAQRTITPNTRAEPASQVAASPNLIGTWSGTVGNLPLYLHIAAKPGGGVDVKADSPMQKAMGLPMTATLQSPTHVVAVLAGNAQFDGELDAAGKLVGRWTQGASIPVQFTRTDASPAALGTTIVSTRPQDPKTVTYKSENLRFTNAKAGIELAGTLTLPQGSGPFPAVVLISGSGQQDRNGTIEGHHLFWVLADHLTRQGIAVLRVDDRGFGESGGNAATATSEDFAGDALAGVAYLRGRPEIAKDKVGLVGHSEGGLIAPMASTMDPGVAFIVMMAGPGLTGEEILYAQGEAIAKAQGGSPAAVARERQVQNQMFTIVKENPDAGITQAKLDAMLHGEVAAQRPPNVPATPETTAAENAFINSQIRMVNNPWMRYFLTYDPRPTLRRVKVPVLALNGTRDLQVISSANLPEIKKALTEGGNRDVTTTELPGLNHLFQTATTGLPDEYSVIDETISPAAMETISKWILEKTRGR
jgi:pimeloyl-ACP methyl ester carboxylesterase